MKNQDFQDPNRCIRAVVSNSGFDIYSSRHFLESSLKKRISRQRIFPKCFCTSKRRCKAYRYIVICACFEIWMIDVAMTTEKENISRHYDRRDDSRRYENWVCRNSCAIRLCSVIQQNSPQRYILENTLRKILLFKRISLRTYFRLWPNFIRAIFTFSSRFTEIIG